MTYPSPYQPPQPNPSVNFNYYQPQADPRGPARRAAIVMYIIGGLGILAGLCFGGLAAMLPELMKNPEFSRAFTQAAQISVDEARSQAIVQTAITLAVGIVFAVLGIFVGKGNGLGSIVTAIVLSVLGILFCLLNVIGVAVMGKQLGGSAVCGAVCVVGIPLAAFALLLVFLIQAARGVSAVRATQDQYAQQYWQYAYQQQMYQQQQQQGYPPPPPPPPTWNPPPPPAPPQDRDDPNA